MGKVLRSAHFREDGKVFAGESFYDPPTERQDREFRGNISVTYGFGTQGAEVEVDLETGEIRVLKMVVAFDVGRALNPMLLEGQIEGGLSMGIGYALLENLVVENGEVKNPTFLDYKMPTVMDMPPTEIILVETDDPAGPYGAKGIGEAGTIPTAAAIGAIITNNVIKRYRIARIPEGVRMILERGFFS